MKRASASLSSSGGLPSVMPKPHVPDLDALSRVQDDELRFYAIIGVLVSLHAGLELTLFEFFAKACGLKREMAATIYYKVKSDEAREGMADGAMSCRLSGKKLATWVALLKRMKSEASQFRHLVSHNPVGRDFHVAVYESTSGTPPLPLPQPSFVFRPEAVHRVRQDQTQVDVGARKPREADFDRLRVVCEELSKLHDDLEAFFASLPAHMRRSSLPEPRAKRPLAKPQRGSPKRSSTSGP